MAFLWPGPECLFSTDTKDVKEKQGDQNVFVKCCPKTGKAVFTGKKIYFRKLHQNVALNLGTIWTKKCRYKLSKVAQTTVNRPIWSHWLEKLHPYWMVKRWARRCLALLASPFSKKYTLPQSSSTSSWEETFQSFAKKSFSSKWWFSAENIVTTKHMSFQYSWQ